MKGRLLEGALVLATLAITARLVIGGIHLASTPRSGAAARAGDSISAAPAQPQSGAPNDDAIPRTRGIEPATSTDPAQEAAVGVPIPTLGVGHRARRAETAGFTSPSPRPSPSPVQRPSPIPSGPRAGTAGACCDGHASAASFRPLPSDCRLPCYGVARVGPASWYDAGPGFYAAIPGYVDGTVVAVAVCTFPDGQANCHTFPVVTQCQCYRHTASEHVVDLSPEAFQLFEPNLLRGIVKVQITVLR